MSYVVWIVSNFFILAHSANAISSRSNVIKAVWKCSSKKMWAL